MSEQDETADRTEITLDPSTARVVTGLRLVVAARDAARADALAEELRAWEVEAARVEVREDADLEEARALDPEVVLLDPTGLRDESLALGRALNADERLRWAAILRCELDKVWPPEDARPDLRRLAALLAPLVNGERTLRRKLQGDESIVMELDRIGPNRLLRVLRGSEGPHTITVQGADARVELMTDGGKVVTTTYDEVHVSAPPNRGPGALERFLSMRSGVVEIVRVDDPTYDADVTTARLGPPSALLLASQSAEEETVDDAFAGDDTLVDPLRAISEKPPPVFPLPNLVDDPLDEVTKRNEELIDSIPPEAPAAEAVDPTQIGGGGATGDDDAQASQGSAVRDDAADDGAASAADDGAASAAEDGAASAADDGAASAADDGAASASDDAAPAPEPLASATTTARTHVLDAQRRRSTTMARAGIVLGLVALFGLVAFASMRGDAEDEGAGEDNVPQTVAAAPAAEPAVVPAPALAEPEAAEPALAAPAVEPAEPELAVPAAEPELAAPTVEPAPTPSPAESASPVARAEVLLAQAEGLTLPRDADRALALSEEALALHPLSARALAGIARAQLARGEPELALEPAERAVGFAPNRSDFRILLGDVQLAVGDREGARASWQFAEARRSTRRVRRRLARLDGRDAEADEATDGTPEGEGLEAPAEGDERDESEAPAAQPSADETSPDDVASAEADAPPE